VDLKAGQIVTVDWRKDPRDPAQDPQPPEPNKVRPAVVVQDTGLFDPTYPTVLVVPMTGDLSLARIATATGSEITPAELQLLRQLVVLTTGGLS
jgi:mRNA-degrading endonuclease toxin of MazEF toxin-antitoxin module